MLNEIFSFLPGCTIIHVVALLSKRIRLICQELGLQENRVITLSNDSMGQKQGNQAHMVWNLLKFTNKVRIVVEKNDTN